MPKAPIDPFLQHYVARHIPTRGTTIPAAWLFCLLLLALASGVLLGLTWWTDPLSPTALAWLGAVITTFAVIALQLYLRLRIATKRDNLLRQLCQLWAQSDGSCLKEISLEGKLLSMNERGQSVMEVCDFGQLAGCDWLAFWSDAWAGPARKAFAEAREGTPSRFSGFCPTAKGTPKWWDVLLMPVLGESGVESVLSLSWDVTEARQASLALEAAHDEQTALLESLDDGFFRLDNNWMLLQVNPKAEFILGQPSETLLGTSLWSLFSEAPNSELHLSLDDAMTSRIPRHFELWSTTLNGWYRFHAYPRPGGLSVFFTATTAEVLNLQRLQSTEARLRISQHIGQFADWQFDLAQGSVALSSQALQLLGVPLDTQGHKDVLVQRLHPDDRLGFVGALLDLTEGKTTMELAVRLADTAQPNRWRHFHFAGALLRPKTHPSGLLIGCIQDISEQKHREQALIDAEIFARTIIDAMPLYVGVLDADGTLVAVNTAWRDLSERSVPLQQDEGDNYLESCRTAASKGLLAAELPERLAALLEGTGDSFELDYEAVIAGAERVFQFSGVLMGSEPRQVLVVQEDLTERVELQRTLRIQAERLRLAHEGSNDGLWEWRPQENQLFVSERFTALTGHDLSGYEDFTSWMLDHVHPEDAELLSKSLYGHLDLGEPFDVEFRLNTPHGWCWFRSRGKAEWSTQKLVRFAGSLMDVSLQHQLLDRVQASEARFRDMVEHLPHVFWEYDLVAERFNYLSPALEKYLGMAPEHVYRDPEAWLRLVHPEDRMHAESFKHRALIEHLHAEVEFRALTPDGQIMWIRDRAFPFIDATGRAVRVVGIAENITEARLYRDRLYTADYFDSETGLPNRHMFVERLESQCRQYSGINREFSVMMVAVDRLHWVRRSLDTSAREELMMQLVQCFSAALAGRGLLASFTGGEFGLLLSREDEVEACAEVAKTLSAAIDLPFSLNAERISLSAKVGIARFPENGTSAELLLKHANIALGSAQSAGSEAFVFFNSSLLENNRDSLKLETELNRALEQREFALYYQPQYSLDTKRVSGAEALIRWQHPVHGLVAPLRFIHLLEDTELIVPVGNWCIDQALRQVAIWRQQGLHDFAIAVNVSLKQLQPALVKHVEAALARHEVPPNCLELELTESIMHESSSATDIVAGLKSLGVRIAVDDFGTGYSTLASLKSFAPDTLKIDKSFLSRIITDASDLAIVRGVIDIARALNMVVVAEGVECEEQKALLERLRCHQIQGYLLSPPMDVTSFEQAFIERAASTI